MTDPISRMKANPTYQRWHFEIGIVVLFAGLCAVGWGLMSNSDAIGRQARLGAQAHVAVCAYRADLRTRARQSREFLHMTVKQRIAKFGPVIGSLPPGSIRTSLANQERTIRSLRDLQC